MVELCCNSMLPPCWPYTCAQPAPVHPAFSPYQVPKIFGAVFECTLQMITRNFEVGWGNNK